MSEKDSLLYIKKCLAEYANVQKFPVNDKIYQGTIQLGKKDFNIIGFFFKDNPILISNTILKKYEFDILFLINLNKKAVILRKKDNCDINLSKLANHLSKGGGGKDIAGCILNDTIINLTKYLEPIYEE